MIAPYPLSSPSRYDPDTQDFWTQCNGKPCAGTWGSPAGNTPKYWFNFSNPRLVDWWVDSYVGEAVNHSLFDGIYFDCSCDKPPGVRDQVCGLMCGGSSGIVVAAALLK